LLFISFARFYRNILLAEFHARAREAADKDEGIEFYHFLRRFSSI